MKFPRLSLSVVFDPTRNLMGNLLSVLDEVADYWYFRFDLWSVPPTYKDDPQHIDYGQKLTRGEADYSKVRGHIAFWMAIGLDIWFFVRTKDMPVVIALLTPIALLAYSESERTFVAFIKALPQIVSGWRGKALGQTVDFAAVDATPGKAREDDDGGA